MGCKDRKYNFFKSMIGSENSVYNTWQTTKPIGLILFNLERQKSLKQAKTGVLFKFFNSYNTSC